MLKVGVVGATGYAGEEVIKILLNHKGVKRQPRAFGCSKETAR